MYNNRKSDVNAVIKKSLLIASANLLLPEHTGGWESSGQEPGFLAGSKRWPSP